MDQKGQKVCDIFVSTNFQKKLSNEYIIICINKCCVHLVKNIILGFLFWKIGLIIEIGERVAPETGDKGDQGYPGNFFS